ncbi:hypothetical protein C0J52_21522 [Blattella germanica]|nr:hypothetical protein C0J52_21522 [Blattella germanica]
MVLKSFYNIPGLCSQSYYSREGRSPPDPPILETRSKYGARGLTADIFRVSRVLVCRHDEEPVFFPSAMFNNENCATIERTANTCKVYFEVESLIQYSPLYQNTDIRLLFHQL